MLKIALAAGAISMAAAADCNGVYINSYTAIATDVCMNINFYGSEMSHMASCDDDGVSATYTMYNGTDCDDADYMNSTDVMNAGLNATYVICDATDCDYAMVTEYESMGNFSWGNWTFGNSSWSTTSSPYNMTTTMSGNMTTTSSGTTTTTPSPTTTTTPSPTTTTTSSGTTTTTSSGSTTWVNVTWETTSSTTSSGTTSSTTSSGCNDFDYSEEVAIVIMDCLDLYGNDTLWFQWKCGYVGDDLTMQFYVGGNCTGGTLAHEQAYTNDSCAEVTCVNATATDTDTDSSSDDTDSSSDDTDSTVDENTSGAASLEHLVAALFAVIALVAN